MCEGRPRSSWIMRARAAQRAITRFIRGRRIVSGIVFFFQDFKRSFNSSFSSAIRRVPPNTISAVGLSFFSSDSAYFKES